MTTKAAYPQKQINEYRYINVEDGDWGESSVEHFKDEMRDIGVYVEGVYYSVAHGQGDGACFEGRVTNWTLFLIAMGIDNPLFVNHCVASAVCRITATGRYQHSSTMSINHLILPSIPEYEGVYGVDVGPKEFVRLFCPYTDPVRQAAWLVVLRRPEYHFVAMEEAILGFLRGKADDLYATLQSDYEYYTSDEAVIEALEANEIEPEEFEDDNQILTEADR